MADMNGVVVPLATPEGKELLLKLEGSRFGAQSKSMLRSFSKQCNNKFCGVTSNVNCINSLCEMDSLRNKYSGDLTPSLQQEQVFLSEKVKHALDEQAVRQGGVTLDELHRLSTALGLRAQIYRPATDKGVPDGSKLIASADEFRELAKTTFLNESQRIIVNFFVPVLKQPVPFGHISPLGGYLEEDDSLLLLDTWPETPVGWVKVDDLYNAMCIVDETCDRMRGCLTVEVS